MPKFEAPTHQDDHGQSPAGATPAASIPGYVYHCTRCGHREEGKGFYGTCPRCGGVLTLEPVILGREAELQSLFADATRPDNMWKYAPLLPVFPPSPGTDLGEGSTPLVASHSLLRLDPAGFTLNPKGPNGGPSPSVNTETGPSDPSFAHGPSFGHGPGFDPNPGPSPQLWLKNETTNPTGAFKDRQVAVGIQKAKELGLATVAVISSGNVAASAAAYAARNHLRCLVFVPETAPAEKLVQASAHGAVVCRVATTSSSLIMTLVEEACQKAGWYHLSTAGCYNPFNVEGAKTIAYELYQQARACKSEPNQGQPNQASLKPFDWILVPVGGGGLLGALGRGFLDLSLVLGCPLDQILPRLVAVQPEGCAPLVRAFRLGWDADQALKTGWENPQTIAGGLADDIPFDAHRALAALKQSRGTAITVSDEEILGAMRALASGEGILAEPSGATSVAGFIKLYQQGIIGHGDRVCCLITGSGLKDAGTVARIGGPIHELKPELREFLNLDRS